MLYFGTLFGSEQSLDVILTTEFSRILKFEFELFLYLKIKKKEKEREGELEF